MAGGNYTFESVPFLTNYVDNLLIYGCNSRFSITNFYTVYTQLIHNSFDLHWKDFSRPKKSGTLHNKGEL